MISTVKREIAISKELHSKYRLANYFFLKLHFCVKLNKTIK